jgi:hypothetical protein
MMTLLPNRKWLRKQWKAIATILILPAIATTGGIVYIIEFTDYPWVWRSTYVPSDGDWALTRKARTAMPMIDALHQYHRLHGNFPSDVSQLAQLLPVGSVNSAGTSVNGWIYDPLAKADTFRLSLKVGWDPGLVYHGTGTSGDWAFEPGDGDPETKIALHP